MITRRRTPGTETVSVTFSVPSAADGGPALSVVGDFNGWDPTANPLRSRISGPPRTTVRLQAGQIYRFRYVTDTGRRLDDDTADGYEPDASGDKNCLLDLLNNPG
jgi:1,4-alpha-glucan branching enzyme